MKKFFYLYFYMCQINNINFLPSETTRLRSLSSTDIEIGPVTIVAYPVAGVVVVLDSYTTVALLESLVSVMVGLLVVIRIAIEKERKRENEREL